MACIVQGTTPARVHAEMFARESGHGHVHETRFTAQNICLSHGSTKDPGMRKVSMHALASALRLHGCALAMCVYFTENTGFDSCTCTWTLQRRVSMHGKGMCLMRRPTSCVHVHHQTDRTGSNFTSLVCSAFLLSVACYAAQERQKAFHSGSPQNALHFLVIFILKVHCHAIQWFYVDILQSKMAARRLEPQRRPTRSRPLQHFFLHQFRASRSIEDFSKDCLGTRYGASPPRIDCNVRLSRLICHLFFDFGKPTMDRCCVPLFSNGRRTGPSLAILS